MRYEDRTSKPGISIQRKEGELSGDSFVCINTKTSRIDEHDFKISLGRWTTSDGWYFAYLGPEQLTKWGSK